MVKSILPPQLSQSEPLSSGYRYELKLASKSASPAQARSWILLHPEGFRVAYAPRIVNNLYFDTRDLGNFNDNLAGVSARQKLRLRWYGADASLVVDPVLELKVKRNMLGSKKQEQLPLTLDLTRTYAEISQTIRAHVSESWQAPILTFNQPALINRYWREYFVSPDHAIRATLDYDLVAYEQRMASRPNLHRRLPRSYLVVIEVKAAPEHFDRLQDLMGYFPILRSQNSKYVQGVIGSLY